MLAEINVLGLRDLKPAFGWLPVTKAFLEFDMSSLKVPGEATSIANIRTTPSDKGPNPTLNTVLKFNFSMPKDKLYCPSLSCAVYDNLFMGLS
jgi:hypothetical protein